MVAQIILIVLDITLLTALCIDGWLKAKQLELLKEQNFRLYEILQMVVKIKSRKREENEK